MKQINFIAGGFLGDFIHSLYVVKNVCLKHNAVANLFLTDGYGDGWRYGLQKAFDDLFELVNNQAYVKKFEILSKDTSIDGFINLNDWRGEVATTHSETGKYNKCWSDLLSNFYDFPIPGKMKWIEVDGNAFFKDKILIHRTVRNQQSHKWWEEILCKHKDNEVLFFTNNKKEFDDFLFKDKCNLFLTSTVNEAAKAMMACKLFIGNQSAPFALASALDINRICELHPDPAPFYIGEERYSGNIKWYLNDEKKHGC